MYNFSENIYLTEKEVYIADINTGEIIVQKLIFSNADILNVTGLKTAGDGKQNPTVDRDNIYQKFGFQVIK